MALQTQWTEHDDQPTEDHIVRLYGATWDDYQSADHQPVHSRLQSGHSRGIALASCRIPRSTSWSSAKRRIFARPNPDSVCAERPSSNSFAGRGVRRRSAPTRSWPSRAAGREAERSSTRTCSSTSSHAIRTGSNGRPERSRRALKIPTSSSTLRDSSRASASWLLPYTASCLPGPCRCDRVTAVTHGSPHPRSTRRGD